MPALPVRHMWLGLRFWCEDKTIKAENPCCCWPIGWSHLLSKQGWSSRDTILTCQWHCDWTFLRINCKSIHVPLKGFYVKFFRSWNYRQDQFWQAPDHLMCVFRQMLVAQSLCKLWEFMALAQTHTHTHLPVIKACIVLILHLRVSVQTHPHRGLQCLPPLIDLPIRFSSLLSWQSNSHTYTEWPWLTLCLFL